MVTDTSLRMANPGLRHRIQPRRMEWAPLTLLSLLAMVVATFASMVVPNGPTTVVLAQGAAPVNQTTLATTADDWPMYQHDVSRSASSADTLIAPSAVQQLRPLWTYQTGDAIVAEPAIVNGVAYVGSWDGYEYAFDTTNGHVLWKTNLGITSVQGCNPQTAGVSSSATVQNGMVYVGGGDSYWYALNASDGSVAWKVFVGDNSATGGHYNWSSPAIYNGYAYVGIASFGDCPLVQGQVLRISLSTHQIVNTFNVVPSGQTGGGVWGSPTIDAANNAVYVTTGNSSFASGYYGQSIVKLDLGNLSLKGYWEAPKSQAAGDSDFGNTPVLFTDSNGRQLVAAINKNGIVYAVQRSNMSAGPVWETDVASAGDCPQCGGGSVSSMTVVNGHVYVAGGITGINGVGFAGSVNELDPTTGAFVWRHGELASIIAPLTSDNGMIFASPGPLVEALDANSGARLFGYQVTTQYAGMSIANGQVIFGSTNGKIYDMALTTPAAIPADANCPTGWTCQDIGSPSAAGSESVSGSTWTLSSDGAGVGGGSDQFRFISQSTTGAAQALADVQAPSATSSGAQAGVMFRQASDANSPYYALYLTPSGALTVRYRSAFGGLTTTYTTSVTVSGSNPLYLQIQRQGDYYAASTSTDGVHFALVPGTTHAISLPDQLLAGVFASSGVDGTLGSAVVSSAAAGALGVPASPAPSAHACPTDWTCQDIGNPSPAGDQTLNNGVWSVTGGGFDVNGVFDQFHYVWQSLPGDGTLSARVNSQTNPSTYAKAGLMLRTSTDPSSPFYAVVTTPGVGVAAYYRGAPGVKIIESTAVTASAPIWVRISRSGSTLTGYYSTNGATWTALSGSSVSRSAYSGTLLAGMMVSSHSSGSASVASISSLNVSACPSQWLCSDIGSPAVAGGQSEGNGGWSVQGAGSDIWNTADQFHYVWQTLPGDGSLSAHVGSQTNTNAWAKAGVMLRLSTNAGSPFYDVVVTPGNGITALWRTAQGASAQTAPSVTGKAAPTWVKAVRSGTSYSGYYSADGTTWTLIPGSTVTIAALVGALDAGMAVSSHNTGAISTATFDTVTLSVAAPPTACPTGWSCADVGSPALTGGQVLNAGVWTVWGAGTDIWNSADQFHYVWQSLASDGTLSAHVTSQTNTDPWAKAGVMLRLTSDPGSPFYDVVVTPGNGITAEWRTAQGVSAQTTLRVTGIAAPAWVEAVRSGTTYSGYYSTNGTLWTQIPGSTVSIAALTGTLDAGLAVSSHNAGAMGEATFDTVTFSNSAPVAPTCPTGWSCADVGSPALSGGQALNAGVWTVQGSGSDIWNSADQFHYVWQSLASDGTLSAHVASQTNTDAWAKAGVMLRLTSDPGSPFYDVVVTPGKGITAQWRTAQGGSAQSASDVTGIVAPVWVEIVRSGTAYSGYYSTNGSTWTSIPGSMVSIAALTGTLDAGMAVTSHNTSAVSTATFDTVTLSNTTPPPPSCPTGWSCADIGSPALAGSESLNAGTWTVQGSGADIWNAADQFHYVWQSLAGDGTLSAHVGSQTNTNAWAKAGVMLRLTSDPGSPFYDVVVTPGKGITAQWRTAQGTSAQTVPAVAGVAPVWVEIVRSGTTYRGYYSTNGSTWTQIPNSTVTIAALTGTLDAGMAVTSHNTSAVGQATFDTVTLSNSTPTALTCPTGWSCADIGSPALSGGQVLNTGTWTVQGSGSDIWNTADQFHYVWQTLPGDGSLSAHVASQTNTNAWAKAGVMLRLSTNAGSPFYDVVVTPGNGITAQWRTAQGASAQTVSAVTGKAVPTWVKIVRSGTSYSGYYSTDGSTWTLIPGSTVTIAALTGTLDAGMAVTSHTTTAVSTATFDTVTIG